MDLAEAEDDSGAEAEIVLAVVEPIRNFCEEVLGLERTNGEVLRDGHVDAPTGGHGKMGLPSSLRNAGTCGYTTEKHVNEGVTKPRRTLILGPNR